MFISCAVGLAGAMQTLFFLVVEVAQRAVGDGVCGGNPLAGDSSPGGLRRSRPRVTRCLAWSLAPCWRPGLWGNLGVWGRRPGGHRTDPILSLYCDIAVGGMAFEDGRAAVALASILAVGRRGHIAD